MTGSDPICETATPSLSHIPPPLYTYAFARFKAFLSALAVVLVQDMFPSSIVSGFLDRALLRGPDTRVQPLSPDFPELPSKRLA